MAEFDAHKYLTYAAPPGPTKYKPNFGEYANDILGYADSRHDKNFEQGMEQQRLAREVSRDTNADERDRTSQEQRARQMLMEDRRSGQREDQYAQQEARRNREAQLNRAALEDADHERLIHALFYAQTPEEQQYAAAELKRHGYTAEPLMGPTAPQQLGPPVGAPPPAAAPPPQRLSAGDTAATSAALDKAGASYGKSLTKGPKTMMPKVKQPGDTTASAAQDKPKKKRPGEDAALDRQLDQADQIYSSGLGVQPWLPGRSPTGRVSPQVAQSDAMLSPGDPYNNIVK